ncbi:hypothetical protein F4678DRAFT_51498 [Xylaria arbuscula]|nr:hypothetical protein F4678DRAFT_51498 [Xylaria arbuscula]
MLLDFRFWVLGFGSGVASCLCNRGSTYLVVIGNFNLCRYTWILFFSVSIGSAHHHHEIRCKSVDGEPTICLFWFSFRLSLSSYNVALTVTIIFQPSFNNIMVPLNSFDSQKRFGAELSGEFKIQSQDRRVRDRP